MSNDALRCTVFKTAQKTYLALANWTDKKQSTKIYYENKALYAPYIRDFQEETKITETLTVESGKGYFIEVKESEEEKC